MSTQQTTENPQTQQKQAVKPDFGNGRYSAEMERIYNAAIKLFGIPPEKAEKIARQAASDAGAVFRNSLATIKVSKPNADNKASLSDASKVKGVTLTKPLNIVRAIEWTNDAMKNGVCYGHTKWKLAPELYKWVEEMTVE